MTTWLSWYDNGLTSRQYLTNYQYNYPRVQDTEPALQRVGKRIIQFMMPNYDPYSVPYDNIGAVDSRWWDPKWRAAYGNSFTSLFKVLDFF